MCCVLLVLKHHLGEGFRFYTEGDFSDWEDAISFYEYVLDRKADVSDMKEKWGGSSDDSGPVHSNHVV